MAVGTGGETYDPYFGRGQAKWESMRERTEAFLINCAKGNCETTYTGVNNELHGRHLPTFDFEKNPNDPHAIGVMLGEISYKSYTENAILLSAICRKSDGKSVGGGFWTMAHDLKLVPEQMTAKEKSIVLNLLSRQVLDYYKPARKNPPSGHGDASRSES